MRARADRACAVLALVGRREHSDHLFLGEVVEHAASGRVAESWQRRIDGTIMLWAMLVMTLALWIYAIAIVLVRVRGIIRMRSGVVENMKPGGRRPMSPAAYLRIAFSGAFALCAAEAFFVWPRAVTRR